MIISKLLSLKLLKDIHLFLGLTIHGFVVKFIRYLHQTYHKIFTSCLCRVPNFLSFLYSYADVVLRTISTSPYWTPCSRGWLLLGELPDAFDHHGLRICTSHNCWQSRLRSNASRRLPGGFQRSVPWEALNTKDALHDTSPLMDEMVWNSPVHQFIILILNTTIKRSRLNENNLFPYPGVVR